MLLTFNSTSYRDLLGTAESIIKMDGQIQHVDTYLGNMGKRCNARLLEKKGANLRTWNEAIGIVGKTCQRSRISWRN